MKKGTVHSMQRREFIRKVAFVSGGVLLAPSVMAGGNRVGQRLTILHTNDTHSNIDPFPANHAKYPGLGGVARRFEMIQSIRQEEEHVLLLDAGDIFQGTPYFNRYGGVLEMKLMTELGYEAATMGNHDFDGGMEGFVKARSFAKFPFLCSNYDFTNTAIDGHTEKHVILKKGKIRVGIFGLGVELKGLVPDDKFKETKYYDPVEMANEQAAQLKEAGCDLVICLSHLGLEYESNKVSDRTLAAQTRGIHLIIGGHTHSFLPEPLVLENLDGQPVLVNQVGWAGVHLGRIDFEFDHQRFSSPSPLIVQ